MSYKNDGSGGGLPPRDLPDIGQGIAIDRDKLKNIAKALQKDLDELSKHQSGTPSDLRQGEKGMVTDAQLGKYPEAEVLAGSVSNAYEKIGSTYDDFLTAYQKVIDSINKAADNHQNAEDATQHAAQQATW
jgi:prefoldin subunit 5